MPLTVGTFNVWRDGSPIRRSDAARHQIVGQCPTVCSRGTGRGKAGYGCAHFLHAVVATPGGDTNFVVAHCRRANLPETRLVVVADLNTVDHEIPELTVLSQGARPLIDAWDNNPP